jgi:Transcriptional regulator, AbiEi antitoxin, Type IV TA system/Transcriptional regulator, AbiEi antitoxin N-terminal domain
MDSRESMKINHLLQVWPAGTVALHAFLAQHGVSRKLAEQYRKGGWIDTIGVGAFVRRGHPVGWEGALYALQTQAEKAIHPGGRTALELRGAAHYLRLGPKRRIDLFGPPGVRLPRWLLQHQWGVQLRYFGSSLLPDKLGLTENSFGAFSLAISSPERAMLEVLDGVPDVTAFEEARQLMEGLPTLRPKLLQQLLEHCTSVKVKRICLYLADATKMPWRDALKESRIDLGAGKRQVVVGGQLNTRYGITVPREADG